MVARLDLTRARVEAELPPASVVAITSAARGDGKTLVATALAYGLAAVGHSVLLVDANPGAPMSSRGALAPKLDLRPEYDICTYISEQPHGQPSWLGLTAVGVLASCSPETVRSTFARFRERYAYTIIDSAVIVESGMALVLASEADAVVVALKQGRSRLEADRDLVKVLHASHTRVLGVVTTRAKAIREFGADADVIARSGTTRPRAKEDGTKGGASLGVRAG